MRVCQTMFSNTHALEENMVIDWLKKETELNGDEDKNFKGDKNEKTRYKDMEKNLRQFCFTLPKVESIVGIHPLSVIWNLWNFFSN